MRRALTLIELIFTIVILSFVVMIVPKIIYMSNKQLEFSNREDAIFNLMAKVSDVAFKEYDENDTVTDNILLNGDGSGDLDCKTSTGYRVGGYSGGRNCLFNNYTDSHIGLDANEPPEDDVDDYNGREENTTSVGHKTYTLKTEVGYTDEWSSSDYSGTSLTYRFTTTANSTPKNIKRIRIVISRSDKNISAISYYSTNIGHSIIKSTVW